MGSDVDAFYKALQGLVEAMEVKGADEKDYNSQDVKFIRGMIPHHEAALVMADKQVSKGKNAEAVSLAKAIQKAQKAEIADMKKWLKERDLSGEGDGGHSM